MTLTLDDRRELERLCDEALALHRAAAPAHVYLGIQETLLAFTLRIEGLSRELKMERSGLRKSFAFEPRKTKEEAAQVKGRLRQIEQDTESCENALRTLRIIGDTVAFSILDAWDIKPFAFKEGPGYLSGKTGLQGELLSFRQAFTDGRIAILNDLTTCLRHGDVTLLDRASGGLTLLEAKSSKNTSSRTVRQYKQADSVLHWLSTDLAEGLYGLPGTFVRGDAHAPPRYHTRLMQELVRKAGTQPFAIGTPEPGLTYVAASEFRDENVVESIRSCRGVPVVTLLGSSTPWPPGHRPVSLLLGSGGALIDFLSGDIVLLVILDSAILIEEFERRGWRVVFDPNKERPIELHTPNPDSHLQMSVGSHIFGRISTEALSLEWFIDETSSVPEPPPGAGCSVSAA